MSVIVLISSAALVVKHRRDNAEVVLDMRSSEGKPKYTVVHAYEQRKKRYRR